MTTKEKVTVLVVPRDRFTPTFKCIDAILEHTEQPYELLVVLGGAPKKIKDRLLKDYGDKAEFIFTDNFLNPAQGRNIALRKSKTRLAAIVDNDVNVMLGWLEALVQCQKETNAAMVVPLILENGHTIHTAGNRYYVAHKDGMAFAHKELCYHGMSYLGENNLCREKTDYGELHCQLVTVKEALKHGVYDENLQEVGECDSAKTWLKHGCELWFEPKSVVSYEIPKRITEACDIRFFKWRWDFRIILKGYEYYKAKWNEDITEYGIFQEFLLRINSGLGLLPRFLPCQWVLNIEGAIKDMEKLLRRIFLFPYALKQRVKSKILGYYEWPTFK